MLKTVYWTSTLLTAIYLSWSAYSYLFSKSMIVGIQKLGFPDFFRVELAVLKIIAVILLLIPNIPMHFKEAAYVGIGLFYLTAIIAHFAHKDPLVINLVNFVMFAVLITSYIYLKRLSGS